jgi:hypothetical protein
VHARGARGDRARVLPDPSPRDLPLALAPRDVTFLPSRFRRSSGETDRPLDRESAAAGDARKCSSARTAPPTTRGPASTSCGRALSSIVSATKDGDPQFATPSLARSPQRAISTGRICQLHGSAAADGGPVLPLQPGQCGQFVETDPPAERAAIARAVAWLYFYAGLQSPIWRDRGGNFDDDTQPGRMDCIDHSTNTTAYLQLMERHGWLKFHAVGERVLRGRMLSDHWAARLVERGSQEEWVIDLVTRSGLAAAVFPLQRGWTAPSRHSTAPRQPAGTDRRRHVRRGRLVGGRPAA